MVLIQSERLNQLSASRKVPSESEVERRVPFRSGEGQRGKLLVLGLKPLASPPQDSSHLPSPRLPFQAYGRIAVKQVTLPLNTLIQMYGSLRLFNSCGLWGAKI